MEFFYRNPRFNPHLTVDMKMNYSEHKLNW